MTASALQPAADIDAAVLERAKRGDQEAFASVIKHYDPGLRALAYRLLDDVDRMDDALQEAYVKAFRSLSSFRGESRLGTWLYRIVYNASSTSWGGPGVSSSSRSRTRPTRRTYAPTLRRRSQTGAGSWRRWRR
jgi:RNA polymerase sigma factor (sigma-70 family)